MSVDFDELIAEKPRMGAKPRMEQVLDDEIDAENRPKVERALRDLDVSERRIVEALGKMGVTVSDTAVRTWRRHHGVLR